MSDREPIAWFTLNGRHIPIFEDEGKKDHFNKHKDVIEKLRSDKYGDGTYNVNTLEPVVFDKGYQFTFCQIGDDYSQIEYNALVNGILSKLSDKTVYAGKFEASPEISFHTMDKNFAMEIGRRYNQISIWDWENCDEIKTGGTGERK